MPKEREQFINIMIVDIDTRRDQNVIIGKPDGFPVPETDTQLKVTIINDMATLCEGLCTLIHLAEQQGIKKSPDSLRDCIKHLEQGFSEAGYQTLIQIPPKSKGGSTDAV
jgi:hypothetical protein